MGRILKTLLATLLFLGMFASGATIANAEEFCYVKGHLVDETTGQPAAGVEWVIYAWDTNSNQWVKCLEGAVDETGAFNVPIFRFPNWPYCFISFHSDKTYYDEYYKDVTPTPAGPNLWLSTSQSCPVTVANVGDLTRATKVPLTSPSIDLGNIGLTPRPNPYGTISGKVTDAYTGVGMPLCSVRAWRRNTITNEWTVSAGASPLDNGSFAISGSAAQPVTGEIRLQFVSATPFGSSVWYPNAPTRDEARTLHVLSYGRIDGVQQAMTIDGRMRGHVVCAETKLPRYDAKVAANQWSAYFADWVLVHASSSDANGMFVVPYLGGAQSGTFRISAFDRGQYYPKTWYGQTLAGATADDVVLPYRGYVDNLDIVLSKVSAVAGRVFAGDGVPVPDLRVEALKETTPGSFSPVGSDYTDCTGLYSIVVPSAGTYTVRFVDTAGTTDTADDTVFYLGGSASVGSATKLWVPNGLATLAPITTYTPAGFERVSRVWGDNRYETAIAASKTSFADGSATCTVLASGADFPDALSASGLAGALDAPVLLTRPDTFYTPLLNEFDRLGVTKVYLLGGYKAIPLAEETLIKALGYQVERLAGADRYETCAKVAEEVASIEDTLTGAPVLVTRGDTFADALSVSPAVCNAGGIVLLVKPDYTPPAIAQVAERLGLTHAIAVGGAAGLPDRALWGLRATGVTTERIAAGATRYETAALFAQVAEDRGWLSADAIGVANGRGFADALGAGAGLGHESGVLLLTTATSLPPETAAALEQRSATGAPLRVYGGTAAVKSSVLVAAGSE